ncbi:hypothetical protein [Streptomyces sp. NPDC101150]|uniref:hypothetical protein n=1 Tax=Streptomyces sp. NPDC101150 TaxID=3366114 RepID=UPI0037F5B089
MTNPIVKALEHGAAKLAKTLGKDAGKAVQDLYHGAGHRLKKVATNHAENDAKHAAELDELLKGGKEDMPHAPHGAGGGRPGAGDKPSHVRPDSMDGAISDPHLTGRPTGDGGHHRWDEIMTSVGDGRIDPETPIRVGVLGGD